MDRRVVISGCSGGGKSSLIAALGQAGYAVVEEPGRRIVDGEHNPASPRLPWNDMATFARAALQLAIADHGATAGRGLVFFDRGAIDALVALRHAAGVPVARETVDSYPYERTVFMAPPWPEIFVEDGARRHGFAQARAEYGRLAQAYPALGYEVVELPRVPVAERVAFVLRQLCAGLA